jgi:predicted  nucleic acid-binding Zn-ribbon protein
MQEVTREEYEKLLSDYNELKQTLIDLLSEHKQMKSEIIEIRTEHDKLREEIALARYLLNNMNMRSNYLN